MYIDEARKALDSDKQKEEKLTADQRIVRDLLRYQEGLDELMKWMKKEHSSENLEYSSLQPRLCELLLKRSVF